MISLLLNFSFPIVGGQLCFIVVLVRYLVEPVLMPRLFPAIFHKIGLVEQRSLTNHVVSLTIKAVVFIVGSYPWISVFLADQQYTNSTDPDPSSKHGPRIDITFGDLLAWCYLTVPTMFLFEIGYRIRISIVSLVHHVASVMITILGLIIMLANRQRNADSQYEFRLILTYGAFEMCFEMYPHVVMIVYRLHRNRPRLLCQMFRAASISVAIGIFIEQIAIGIFYWHVWHQWSLVLTIIGLILHFCFVAAQVHGARLYWLMARKMAKEVVERTVDDREKSGGEGVNAAQEGNNSNNDHGTHEVTEIPPTTSG